MSLHEIVSALTVLAPLPIVVIGGVPVPHN